MKTITVWDGPNGKSVAYSVDDVTYKWAAKFTWFLKGGSPTSTKADGEGGRTSIRLAREIYRRRMKRRLAADKQVTFKDDDPTNCRYDNLVVVKRGRVRGIKRLKRRSEELAQAKLDDDPPVRPSPK